MTCRVHKLSSASSDKEWTYVYADNDEKILQKLHFYLKRLCSPSVVIELDEACEKCAYTPQLGNCRLYKKHEKVIKLNGDHALKIERILLEMGLLREDPKVVEKRLREEKEKLELKLAIEKVDKSYNQFEKKENIF